MAKVTVPTTVDLAAQRVKAGDDIEFIQKFNQFQAKLEQFSSQLAQYTSDFEREYGSVLTLSDKATKTDFGVTKLSSSTSSTAEDEAATSKAVNDLRIGVDAAKLGKTEKAADSWKLGGITADGFPKYYGDADNQRLDVGAARFAFLQIAHNGKKSWDVGKGPDRDFFINRFDANGEFIDAPMLISATTGKVKFTGFGEGTVWSGNLSSVILGTNEWWPGDGFFRVGISTGEDLLIYARRSGVSRGTQYAVGRSYYAAARCVNGTFKVEGANLADGSYQSLNITYINKIG